MDRVDIFTPGGQALTLTRLLGFGGRNVLEGGRRISHNMSWHVTLCNSLWCGA